MPVKIIFTDTFLSGCSVIQFSCLFCFCFFFLSTTKHAKYHCNTCSNHPGRDSSASRTSVLILLYPESGRAVRLHRISLLRSTALSCSLSTSISKIATASSPGSKSRDKPGHQFVLKGSSTSLTVASFAGSSPVFLYVTRSIPLIRVKVILHCNCKNKVPL